MITWLTKDWGIKLISLLLAVGLWYYAVGEESVEVKRTIPLEIIVKNKQMSVLRTSVKSVWVTLAAPRNLLSDLTSKDIRALHEIEADVKTAGDYTFRLEPREIKLPSPQIRVVKIVPEVIQVTIDELIVQKLKIIPQFVGEPAFGYKVRMDEIEMDPNALLVEGPKGQLEKLDAISTEKIDLIGRIRSFRRTVNLMLPPNVKPLSESTVDIFIPIKEEFGEKEFESIPVKILQPSENAFKAKLETGLIQFTLKGSRLQLEKLKPEMMLAYVDTAGLTAGEHEIEVQMILPEDVTLKEPVKVKAFLSPLK